MVGIVIKTIPHSASRSTKRNFLVVMDPPLSKNNHADESWAKTNQELTVKSTTVAAIQLKCWQALSSPYTPRWRNEKRARLLSRALR
jgi:hypothetical protein